MLSLSTPPLASFAATVPERLFRLVQAIPRSAEDKSKTRADAQPDRDPLRAPDDESND